MESLFSELKKLSEKPYSLRTRCEGGIIKPVQDRETKTLLMAIANVLHRYSGSQWPEFRNTSSTGQSIRLITGRFLVQVQGVPFAAKMQINQTGTMVKRLRHHPFTVVSRVRISLVSFVAGRLVIGLKVFLLKSRLE